MTLYMMLKQWRDGRSGNLRTAIYFSRIMLELPWQKMQAVDKLFHEENPNPLEYFISSAQKEADFRKRLFNEK